MEGSDTVVVRNGSVSVTPFGLRSDIPFGEVHSVSLDDKFPRVQSGCRSGIQDHYEMTS